QLRVAEQYVALFGEIARKTTAVVVPANLTDVAGMIAAAMRVFDTAKPGGPSGPPPPPAR
ncbi:MAG TPA: band-7 C-terminal domain-containing protein, partial [Thermoanaerobaculia bacterium]|nr:band-7 C-terminal domain-containing protein [Thermoanaerobaculia bacterium]